MRTIGRAIQKFLTIIVILLILGTIGIFVYPSVADKTELDDKAVAFLAKQADKLVEETTEDTNEGEEVGKEDTFDSTTETEEIFISTPTGKTTVDDMVRDDSRTQTWTAEEKDELKIEVML